MKRLLCIVLSCLSLLLSTAATAQDIELNVRQMQALAVDLWKNGQSVAAAAVSSALLQRDANDYVGLLIAADTAANQGDIEQAVALAQRAWRVAKTDAQRNETARLTASVLFRADQPTRAQIWLRRAIQSAPDKATRDRTIAEFKQVRRLNPVRYNLRFSTTQSDNVNGGSAQSEIEIFGLPFQLSPDAQALSGREVSYGASVDYTLAEQRDSRWILGASLAGRDIYLSDESQEAAPNLENSSFAFRELGTSLRYDWITGDATAWSANADIARNWYGGEHLSDRFTLVLSQKHQLNQRNAITTFGRYTRELRKDTFSRSSNKSTMGLSWQHVLPDGPMAGLFSVRGELFDTVSESAAVDATGWNLGLGYQLGREILGTQISFDLSHGETHFERQENVFFPIRDDKTTRANAKFVFTGISYFGFSPSLSINHTRRESNSVLYDSRDTGIELGIQSSF